MRRSPISLLAWCPWLLLCFSLAAFGCSDEGGGDDDPSSDGSGDGDGSGGNVSAGGEDTPGGPAPGGSSSNGGDTSSPGTGEDGSAGSGGNGGDTMAGGDGDGNPNTGGTDTPAGTPPSLGPDLPLPTAVTTFYVSSSEGDDSWSGTLEEPNGSGDGPKATLGAAIDLVNGAAPGTHVLLRRGDTFMAGSPLEIGRAVGTEEDPIVLGAYGEGDQPTILSQHMGETITVRSSQAGPSMHFRMDDLHLTGSAAGGRQTAIYTNEGLHPELPHHLTFSKLTIEGNGTGMTLYGHDIVLHGSRVANNTMGMGVYAMVENITFSYNEFENNGLPPPDTLVHSLYLSDCDGILFEHNVVHSATDGVKARRVDNSTFRYNTFHDIIAIGIHLGGDMVGGAVNNRIEGNLFYDNGMGIAIKSESGMQTDFLDGLVIANNILHSSTEGFVEFGSHVVMTDIPARNVAVVNNLLYDMIDDNGIMINNSGENITIANNIVAKFNQGFAFGLPDTAETSNNLEFSSAAEFEALNLADPESFDFTPTAESTMLIDQGTDLSEMVDVDYAENPRPMGSGFDIGPYEYQP